MGNSLAPSEAVSVEQHREICHIAFTSIQYSYSISSLYSTYCNEIQPVNLAKIQRFILPQVGEFRSGFVLGMPQNIKKLINLQLNQFRFRSENIIQSNNSDHFNLV